MKIILFFILILIFIGCSNPKQKNEVIVYTSVDQHYSEPVLTAFEKETGIHVRTVYDVEASKTTGLVNRLIAEQRRPKADIFWNGGFVQTAHLASLGILVKYKSSVASASHWSDPKDYWSAFGGRARVMIVNREKIDNNAIKSDLSALLDPKWPPEKIGFALPLFGTAATHAAAIWSQSGIDKASDFFKTMKQRGISFVDGNSVVRDKVASGELWLGITDSDDACAAINNGKPIDIFFLNQGSEDAGALVIPNTVAMIAGGPNSKNAEKLIDYLHRTSTKEHLVRLGWLQIVNGRIASGLDCPLPTTIYIQNILPQKIIDNFKPSQNYLRKLLLR